MQRRDLLKIGALSTIGAGLSFTNGFASQEQGALSKNSTNKVGNKKRVIIIGGGFAGLSVAKNIRISGDSSSEILVFDPKNIFASCPYSNLYLGNIANIKYEDLLFSPLEPASKYNYQIVNDKVMSIDKKRKTITTLQGDFEYSYLVIATGIEYDYSTYGLNEESARVCKTLYPASYNGGNEQLSLKKKIENFKGGNFVITVPKGSYRCPPAPYERACLVANYFKSKNLKAKVILLDPREKPAAKSKGFLEAFNTLYKDYIEYLPTANITNIDLESKKIIYDSFDIDNKRFISKSLVFDDANIIPSNKATKLLSNSGLAVTSSGWGRAKNPSFQSLNDDYIYLVGDVLGEYPFPKSGQMANSCGIILGEHLAKILEGRDPNVGQSLPGNVCYSMVSKDTAIAVTHETYLKDGEIAVRAELFEKADKQTALATHNWYLGITQNIFE